MAKKGTITRAELTTEEEPDSVEKALFLLRLHANKILTVLAVAFAIWAVIIFNGNRKESKLAAASDIYYDAVTIYEKGLNENPWSSEERAKAMGEVVGRTDLIINDYPGTPIAHDALLLKGNAYYFVGDPLGKSDNTDKAIDAYKLYADGVDKSGDKLDAASADLLLAYAYENKFVLLAGADSDGANAALKSAQDAYNRVIAAPDAGFLKDEALMAIGRLSLAKPNNDPEQAKKAYGEVVKDSYTKLAEPGEDATQRDQQLWFLRNQINQTTVGARAAQKLEWLGEDPEKYTGK